MTDELRIFLATIYGEAAASSAAAWRAIASCILNRVGQREWRKRDTVLKVIALTGFDAFEQENTPYRLALSTLAKHPDPPGALGRLKDAVLPLYLGKESTIPHLVLYYSPKAQARLHMRDPRIWPAAPRWSFALLERIWVEGTEADDFAWFRYKAGA